NAAALVAGISRLHADAQLSMRLRANGPRAARAYDRKHLAGQMLDVLARVSQRMPSMAEPSAPAPAAPLPGPAAAKTLAADRSRAA
ncbi:MAG: hypothetical protein K2Y29_19385, partial [Beijerinckiaceae bacterium]|nr:hypothetical protein [Beijerinckiaceae bacterium]